MTIRLPDHVAGVVAVILTVAALSACSGPDDDGGAPTPSPTATASATAPSPDPTTVPSAEDVRATLGAVAPCRLLSAGTTAAAPEGPHTCEAQLGADRVRVAVGVSFDDDRRGASEPVEVAGLVAYTSSEACRTVFPAGPAHGISVEVDGADGACRSALDDAAMIVGTALTTGADSLRREPGPDSLTACGLLATSEPDDSLLVDDVGEITARGLDHCEVATGPVLARTSLGLDYSRVPFDELVRLLVGDPIRLAGQDAVVRDGQTCFVHTYLWTSAAEGRGPVRTEAVVHAGTCREAERVTAAVIRAARRDTGAPGHRTWPTCWCGPTDLHVDNMWFDTVVRPQPLWRPRDEQQGTRPAPHAAAARPAASTPVVHTPARR